jgi:hypothetical protein
MQLPIMLGLPGTDNNAAADILSLGDAGLSFLESM